MSAADDTTKLLLEEHARAFVEDLLSATMDRVIGRTENATPPPKRRAESPTSEYASSTEPGSSRSNSDADDELSDAEENDRKKAKMAARKASSSSVANSLAHNDLEDVSDNSFSSGVFSAPTSPSKSSNYYDLPPAKSNKLFSGPYSASSHNTQSNQDGWTPFYGKTLCKPLLAPLSASSSSPYAMSRARREKQQRKIKENGGVWNTATANTFASTGFASSLPRTKWGLVDIDAISPCTDENPCLLDSLINEEVLGEKYMRTRAAYAAGKVAWKDADKSSKLKELRISPAKDNRANADHSYDKSFWETAAISHGKKLEERTSVFFNEGRRVELTTTSKEFVPRCFPAK